MATMMLTWPHGVKLEVTDDTTSRTTFVTSVIEALRDGGGYMLTLPKTSVIVPEKLLDAALIEVKD